MTATNIDIDPGNAAYVCLEVMIHGLNDEPDSVARLARELLAPTFAQRFDLDLDIEIIEHAGGRCANCPDHIV